MSESKTVFYSVATLARLADRTPRAVRLRIQQQDIQPDAELLLPDGRRAALFKEETITALLAQKSKEKP